VATITKEKRSGHRERRMETEVAAVVVPMERRGRAGSPVHRCHEHRRISSSSGWWRSVAVARAGGTLAGRDAGRWNRRRSSGTGTAWTRWPAQGACGGGTAVEVKRGEKRKSR
jgi:hypothetical protein